MVIRVLCSRCGSDDWVRCLPGTSSDARAFIFIEEGPADPVAETPLVAYCKDCDPWMNQQAGVAT